VFGQQGPNAADEHVFHFHEELVLRLLVMRIVGCGGTSGDGQHRVLGQFVVILYPAEPGFRAGCWGVDEAGRDEGEVVGDGRVVGGRGFVGR